MPVQQLHGGITFVPDVDAVGEDVRQVARTALLGHEHGPNANPDAVRHLAVHGRVHNWGGLGAG